MARLAIESDDELPALADVFAAAKKTGGKGGVKTEANEEAKGAERRTVRRRVLGGVADNPLLRPLGDDEGLLGKERGGVGRRKGVAAKKVEEEGLVRQTTTSIGGLRTRKEKAAGTVDVRICSDDEDVPVSRPQRAGRGVTSRTRKEKGAGRVDVRISSDDEDVPVSKLRRAGRAGTSRTQKAEIFEEEEEQSCEDESDDMSDFIVNDSSASEEEDEEEETRPPPRSVRKLVRGRRPESPKSVQHQKPTQPAPAPLLDWSDDDAVEERRPAPLPVSRRLFSKENEDPFHISEEESPILTFDPAEDKATRRPCKETRFATPPSSPQKTQKSLVSPKKTPRIPVPPHRQSMDDFWQPDVINDWNDEFSPRKQLSFKPSPPQSIDDINTVSPSKKGPIKKDKAAVAAKKDFLETRHALADAFLKELDATLTNGQIASITAPTGGVHIVWSKKLATTAGRAHWRREAVRPSTSGGAVTYRHHASIELAEKVIDDAARLLNVLAHEFCHLANFMVSGVTTRPHGREFKMWAARCSRAFGERGVEVTTRHSYEIEYKYVWMCVGEGCRTEYKRHSRSIDVRTERCGRCRGVLVQTKPAPRAGGGMGEYQAFVKEHMARVRRENPGSPQKEIMGLVGKRYQEYKATRLRESVVQSGGDEVEVGEDPVDVLVKKIDFLDLTSP